MNNKGPRTLPCGTPMSFGNIIDEMLLTLTN